MSKANESLRLLQSFNRSLKVSNILANGLWLTFSERFYFQTVVGTRSLHSLSLRYNIYRLQRQDERQVFSYEETTKVCADALRTR